jgi:hypothetical protein
MYEHPEGCQELRPQHAKAIINKTTMQQVGIKYICNWQIHYMAMRIYGNDYCLNMTVGR